jgi:hypothetical protein
MTKKLLLQQHDEQYREHLSELKTRLEKELEEIFGTMVNLAMTGKMKAWSDAQPKGSVIHFDHKMLLECGDELIADLYQIGNLKDDLIEKINLKLAQ